MSTHLGGIRVPADVSHSFPARICRFRRVVLRRRRIGLGRSLTDREAVGQGHCPGQSLLAVVGNSPLQRRATHFAGDGHCGHVGGRIVKSGGKLAQGGAGCGARNVEPKIGPCWRSHHARVVREFRDETLSALGSGIVASLRKVPNRGRVPAEIMGLDGEVHPLCRHAELRLGAFFVKRGQQGGVLLYRLIVRVHCEVGGNASRRRFADVSLALWRIRLRGGTCEERLRSTATTATTNRGKSDC